MRAILAQVDDWQESVPIPVSEFSGAAIVTLSVFAASLYLLRRKRK